jgi:hypothetical protein
MIEALDSSETSVLTRAARVISQKTAYFTANVVPNWLIFALMMEAIRSSETSVLTRATRRHISEYGILHIFLSVFIIVMQENGILILKEIWMSFI